MGGESLTLGILDRCQGRYRISKYVKDKQFRKLVYFIVLVHRGLAICLIIFVLSSRYTAGRSIPNSITTYKTTVEDRAAAV